MGKLADQAAALEALLDTIPKIGVTFAYQPLPKNTWDKFVASFTATIDGKRRVRAWTIQYLGEERVTRTIAMGNTKTLRRIRWVVRGHDSWDDPTSEIAFRDLVEAVVTVLDAARSLSGTAIDHDPCQVDIPNDGGGVVLGDVLCHFCEIHLTADTEQTLVTS